MQLDPDEIERRSFAIEDRGYDRDEVRAYLLGLATELRSRAPTGVDTDDADGFARLGAEVAEVLRTAHESVAGLHRRAEAEIAVRHEQAEADADAVRRQAQVDAATTQDQARRVLVAAQEQADTILTAAEAAAAGVVEDARREARAHTEELTARTRRHAEQVRRAERDALRRLHEAQAGLTAAAELLSGSDARPVVDLTELRPHVRLGDPPSAGADDAGDADDEPIPVRSSDDPVVAMIRRAVARAAEAAQSGPPTTDGVTAASPRPVAPPGPARAPAVPRRVEPAAIDHPADRRAAEPGSPPAGPLPPRQATAPPAVASLPAGPAQPPGGTPF